MSLSFVAFVSCSDDKENEQSGPGNVPENSSSVLSSSGKERGHSYVDLGLPSGTLWATCNVGAATPQDYGNHYAWGEVTTKENYSWYTYLDGNISSDSDWETDKDALKGVFDIAGTQYDAAAANWGGKWRMPTKAQLGELRGQCYWVWTENYNGSNVKGYIVYKAKTSSDKGQKIYKDGTPSSSYSLSDAHIFLPAAGFRDDSPYYDSTSVWRVGYYRSSSLNSTDFPDFAWEAWTLYIDSNEVTFQYVSSRYNGYSVRAVISGE